MTSRWCIIRLTVLMLAGIREIMIITTPHDQEQFIRTLGDGSQWGMSLQYKVQPSPDGLAQAFILAEDFLAGAPCGHGAGRQHLFGHGLPTCCKRRTKPRGRHGFGYRVPTRNAMAWWILTQDGTVQHH